MTSYLGRDMAPAVLDALEALPVVVLTGMRQTGKTTFLQHQPEIKGRRYITFDDFATLEAARRDPEELLGDGAPMTIDEAQKCPELLTSIKRAVDRDRKPGRFLLSGSANFALLKGVSESLAGRAIYLALQPFSRREISDTSGSPPFLRAFFDRPEVRTGTSIDPVRAEEVLKGGMPPAVLGGAKVAGAWFRSFEQTYLERDLRDLAQVGDLVQFRGLMQLASLRTAQVLNQSNLARDARMNAVTTGRHLGLLEASFVIHRVPPFLRNRTSRLIKAPKLYLADSGLAAHLAGVKDLSLTADEPLRGALWETYVAQNLLSIVGAHFPGGRLDYWNVQGRHEVDFVIEEGRASLAIEVKASSRWGDADLAGLRAFLDSTPGCRAGVLAYNGRESVHIGDRLWALPLGRVLA